MRSEFAAHAGGARLHPSVHRPRRRSTRWRPASAVTAYVGFDCTADSLHVGNLVSIMMLRHLQRTGPPADRAGRRRHDQGRRPVGQGREPAAADRGADRRQQARHRALARASFLDFGDRRGRCWSTTPSGWTSSRYIPFLRDFGTPLHHQPHADLRFGQAAARARAAADAARVQLHGHAGLRLPRAVAPLRLPAADGRLGPVGQHRQRRRARPPDRRPRSCSA